jgi:two-component system chemotaxis response regulator CheY
MAYTIMIVDDSALMRQVIAKTLNVAGVAIGKLLEAANGREALDLLRQDWVDLVFSDINMPEMNGLELLKQMAADDMLKSVPVVVISTERSEARAAELKAAGVKEIIRKPFTPETIKSVVDRLLSGGG